MTSTKVDIDIFNKPISLVLINVDFDWRYICNDNDIPKSNATDGIDKHISIITVKEKNAQLPF
jgi:hypothetical protein